MFNEPLFIDYEASYFEATRFRRPLLKGWNDVIAADPKILLDRGYDKVIVFTRDLYESCKAQALYFRGAKTQEDYKKLLENEPRFFRNIMKKWKRLNKRIDDPRIFYTSIDEWNNRTLQTYNRLLDFLEFPKKVSLELNGKYYIKTRPLLAPVMKCKEDMQGCGLPCEYRKNFDAYSDSHEALDHIPCPNIARIRGDTSG